MQAIKELIFIGLPWKDFDKYYSKKKDFVYGIN